MSDIGPFEIGYLLACANLVAMHDEPGMAADLVAELGIAWVEVEAAGLSDFDMKALRKIRAERGGKVFADDVEGNINGARGV